MTVRSTSASGGAGGTEARVRERAARRFYPEVQALRAVAIGMVLLFHFLPGVRVVSGMYIGVDVFFVISGYLISSHLISEVDRTGTVRLGAFYARRARRLLPASLSVLAISLLLTPVLLPRDEWVATGRAVLAAAFYAFNLLAAHARWVDPDVDVFALPTVHYWSLSAEEQFYLLWPPLILLAVAIAARRRVRGRASGAVTSIGVTLLVVAVVSFVVSVFWTAQNSGIAFFMTPTRVWEFAAGGLVTLVLRRWAPTERLASLMRWVGLILILPGSYLLLLRDVAPGPAVVSAGQAFPGPMALPSVLGTALVILAGAPRVGSVLDRLIESRPTQWLGLVSYSAYLWHWPLLVFANALFGGAIGGPRRIVVLVLTLVLAHVWQKWVEDATRFVPGMKESTRMTLWTALIGMIVIAAGALVLMAAG